MSPSTIEWTDVTWNPVRGCSRVSEGCRNCYAERQAARFGAPLVRDATGEPSGGGPFEGFVRDGKWTGRVELVLAKLLEPLSWRKPRRVFVNSMSDLFHEALPFESIDRVFAVMALAQQHTFQVLTKRPERMREYLNGPMSADRYVAMLGFVAETKPNADMADFGLRIEAGKLLIPNVWLGVSVEDQATADARIPVLLDTPAAVRFVSAEPLLGQLKLEAYVQPRTRFHLACDVQGMIRNRSFSSLLDDDGSEIPRERAEAHLHSLAERGVKLIPTSGCDDFDPQKGCRGHRLPRLDWLIVGGESGPGARPCYVEHVRSVVELARAAGVACFVKQLGARCYSMPYRGSDRRWTPEEALDPNGEAIEELGKILGASRSLLLRDRKGGDPSEWPEDLRVREFPAGD
jgi:protein gp37